MFSPDVKENPKEIVMNELDGFMTCLQQHYPDTYHNHLHNLPAFMNILLTKNKADFSILSNGKEEDDKDAD